jgi:putative DNA primase/helicase
MKTNTKTDGRTGASGSIFEMPEIEPWPEPVDGAALLSELRRVFGRFVVLPKWADDALALWTLHTYAFQSRDVSTYVGLESPEKRCGKTTLLTVLSELVNRPVVAANISSSALFRVIEEVRPTLLIDEADTFLQGNDELRGILNCGYTRKTAYVVRVASRSSPSPLRNEGERGRSCETASPPLGERAGVRGRSSVHHSLEGLGTGEANFREIHGEREPDAVAGGASRLVRYSCWCPKIMAAIGRLPDTLADRCIVVRMQRKTGSETCERLKNLDATPLRRQCARFAQDHAQTIARAQPELPAQMNDRAGDIWEPLLALADLAGGPWPELARQAAVGLAASAQEHSPISALLFDIAVQFVHAGAGRIFSRDMVLRLNNSPDRPWAMMRHGKAINEPWLSEQLRHYGIRPRTMRIGTRTAKGYAGEDFTDIFRRYVPVSEFDAYVEAMQEGAKPADPPPVV